MAIVKNRFELRKAINSGGGKEMYLDAIERGIVPEYDCDVAWDGNWLQRAKRCHNCLTWYGFTDYCMHLRGNDYAAILGGMNLKDGHWHCAVCTRVLSYDLNNVSVMNRGFISV